MYFWTCISGFYISVSFLVNFLVLATCGRLSWLLVIFSEYSALNIIVLTLRLRCTYQKYQTRTIQRDSLDIAAVSAVIVLATLLLVCWLQQNYTHQ